MTDHPDTPEVEDYEGWHVAVSAVVGILVAAVLAWWATNFAVFYEAVPRIAPTVEGGGVGTEWIAGNTVPALDFLIALVHAMDVIMGAFILFLVFVHWAAFRRLADRMGGTAGSEERTAVADGGEVDPPGGDGQ